MLQLTRVDFRRVNAAIDFRVVFDHYGIESKGGGPQFSIKCPFHDDNRASCGCSNAKLAFQCFACKETGNALDFVTKMEGLDPGQPDEVNQGAHVALDIMGLSVEDFRYGSASASGTGKAKKRAAKPAGTGVKAKKPTTSKGKKTEKQEEPVAELSPAESNQPLEKPLSLITDHAFFAEHGIADEIVEAFGLGFCKVGVMRGRICIPLHDAAGNLIGYSGRWPSEEIPEGQVRYKLPKAEWGFRKSHMLFNLHRAIEKRKRHVVVVEGFWSAMRLDQLGLATVALMGTSIGDVQVGLLAEHGFTHATVIMDGDEQGQNAAGSVVEQISTRLYVRQLALPDGEKPDTMGSEWLERIS